MIVVSVYMLLDAPRLSRFLRRVFPGAGPEDDLVTRVERALLAYVRGQTMVSLAVGATAGVGLWILGVTGVFPGGKTYALVFGAWAAAVEIIPYVGPWLGALAPAAVAATQSGTAVIAVAILFLFIHQIEGHIIVPKLMGGAVKVHPLVVIFALLAAGELFGLAGRAARDAAGRDRPRGGRVPARADRRSSRGATRPIPVEVEIEPPAADPEPPAAGPRRGRVALGYERAGRSWFDGARSAALLERLHGRLGAAGPAQELAVPAVGRARARMPAVLPAQGVDRGRVGLLGAVDIARSRRRLRASTRWASPSWPGTDRLPRSSIASRAQLRGTLGVALLQRPARLLDGHEALVHAAHAVAVGAPGRRELAAGGVGLAVVEQDVREQEVRVCLLPLVPGLVRDLERRGGRSRPRALSGR